MPVVDTTQSFATGDTVTSTTLNNIMDQSIFVAGAVVSGSGLAITSGGQMTTSNIPGANIANGTITGGAAGVNSKIANSTITPTNLSSGAPAWTASTTSLGNAVTGAYTTNIAPARTGDGSTALQFGSQATVSNSASITRNTGVNGTFAIANTGTGAITLSSSGGVTFGTANMPTPSGNAPVFGCRAWVNFDATRDSTGAVSSANTNRFIRQSGNVSSVLKTANGVYTVTFTTALPDADFAVYGSVSDNGGTTGSTTNQFLNGYQASSSTATITTTSTGNSLDDYSHVSVCVIR